MLKTVLRKISFAVGVWFLVNLLLYLALLTIDTLRFFTYSPLFLIQACKDTFLIFQPLAVYAGIIFLPFVD